MAPVIEVDDILSRKESMKVIDRDEFYGHMQQVGFDYKKSFKTVKTISYSDTEVLVRLETFFDETVKEGTMELHPSVLDGAFQAVVPLLLEKIKTEQKIYFPYSVGEISIYSALEK